MVVVIELIGLEALGSEGLVIDIILFISVYFYQYQTIVTLITNDLITVFFELLKVIPQEYEETVMLMQEKITSIMNNQDRVNEMFTPSPTRLRTTTKYEKSLELKISQLKVSTVTSPKISGLELIDQKLNLQRFDWILMNDPVTNVYLAEQRISDISMNSVAELLCGMLNSNKGGQIHIGFHSSGRIEGIRISHSDRDSFRSGVDHIFLEELTPLLLPDLVKIKFYPVSDRERKTEDLCVVKIIVAPQINTVCYLKKQGHCFRFVGGKNEKLQLPEVRLLSVMMTEKRIAALSNARLH